MPTTCGGPLKLVDISLQRKRIDSMIDVASHESHHQIDYSLLRNVLAYVERYMHTMLFSPPCGWNPPPSKFRKQYPSSILEEQQFRHLPPFHAIISSQSHMFLPRSCVVGICQAFEDRPRSSTQCLANPLQPQRTTPIFTHSACRHSHQVSQPPLPKRKTHKTKTMRFCVKKGQKFRRSESAA